MNPASSAESVVDGVSVDAVHDAALACEGVSRLGGPGLAGLTTYLPGRQIAGIRVNSDSVDLDVVAVWGPSAADIAAQIRGAVRGLVTGRQVNITITDVDSPDAGAPAPAQPPVRPAAPQPVPVAAPVPEPASLPAAPTSPVRPAPITEPESEL